MGGAVALGITFTGAGGKYYADDPLFWPRQLLNEVTHPKCEQVSAEVEKQVAEQVAKPPKDPVLVQLEQDYESGRLDDAGYQQRYMQWVRTTAERDGLHVVDPRPYMAEVAEANTADEVLSALSGYTRPYGFSVTMPHKADLRDAGNPTFVREGEVDIETLRQAGSDLLDILYPLPAELMRAVDVNGIRIVSELEAVDGGAAVGTFKPAGEADTRTGIIYLPLKALHRGLSADQVIAPEDSGLRKILAHEIGHRLDGKLCGPDAAVDEAYTGYNTPDFTYGSKWDERVGRKNVLDSYGARDPLEDKGRQYERILPGLDPKIRGEGTVIREKNALLLGRLEEKVPGIARYLSELGELNAG